MDINQQLKQLKETTDRSLLHDVVFTREMEQKVREKVERKKRFQVRIPRLARFAAVASVVFLLLVGQLTLPNQQNGQQPSQQPHNQLPGAVWQLPSLWMPSPEKTELFEGSPLTYQGEKPVRIISGEMYEGQTQKVMWLLNGPLASEVEIVAVNEQGTKLSMGKWQVSEKLYDADGHFPSGIAIPDPGIWKLMVMSNEKYFGHVFVEVKPGIMEANRLLVEPLLNRYLQTNEEFGWLGKEQSVTIHLFGVDSPNAEVKKVYTWVKILSQDKWKSSGISAPMAFEIRYTGNDYKVFSHQMPKDGNLYWSSIGEIFPKKYVEKIKGYSPQ